MNAETIWERNLETGVLRLYFQSPILPHLHVTVHQLPILCTLVVFLGDDKWAVLLPRLCSRWSAPPSPVLSVKLAATTDATSSSAEWRGTHCNYYSSHVSWERVTIDTWTIWYCRINWYCKILTRSAKIGAIKVEHVIIYILLNFAYTTLDTPKNKAFQSLLFWI